MQQKGSFSMQAAANRNLENSECKRCGLSARKGMTGVHSAGEVWYQWLPCYYFT